MCEKEKKEGEERFNVVVVCGEGVKMGIASNKLEEVTLVA